MSTTPLHNPYLGIEGYNCFGCSPTNPYGLHLRFFYDDEADDVYAVATPAPEHCGYPGVLHGGIQATLMDEVGYWAVHQRLHAPAFTTRMEVALIRAVRIPSEIVVRARIVDIRRKMVTVEAQLTVEGEVHASARIRYYQADAAAWERVTGRPVPSAVECPQMSAPNEPDRLT